LQDPAQIAAMPVRPPSLRAIAAFEAAARSGSFARAAEELNLTPGAVSHAIRGLEARLGQKLFERQGRNVRLSFAGREFAARVRMGLALLLDAFGPDPAGTSDALTISTTPSIARKLLVPRLAAIERAFPGLRIDLKVTNALEDFASGRVDLALRFGPGEWAGLKSRILAREMLTPMCSPGYRDSNSLSGLPDLKRCRLIRHPAGSWRLWLGPLGLDESDYRSDLLIDDGATVLDAAMMGHGVALGRMILARDDTESGRLVCPLPGEVEAEYVYASAWLPNAPRRALAERFSDWFAASLVADDEPH
jgi:LysR family glycine cleavage system transcriptional activator